MVCDGICDSAGDDWHGDVIVIIISITTDFTIIISIIIIMILIIFVEVGCSAVLEADMLMWCWATGRAKTKPSL